MGGRAGRNGDGASEVMHPVDGAGEQGQTGPAVVDTSHAQRINNQPGNSTAEGRVRGHAD